MRFSALLPRRTRGHGASEAARLAPVMIPAPVAEAERPVTDAGAPAGNWPYQGQSHPARDARSLLGPSLRLAPSPRTMPQPALRANARPASFCVAATDLRELPGLPQAVREVDLDAVGEARKTEGATHVSVRRARGPAPFHDAILKAWQPLQGPRLPGADYLGDRITALKYPSLGGPASDYADVLGWATAITGTTGFPYRQWPLLAVTAGGAL